MLTFYCCLPCFSRKKNTGEKKNSNIEMLRPPTFSTGKTGIFQMWLSWSMRASVSVCLLEKLLQNLGVCSRFGAGGFLAAGFGIVLGCGALWGRACAGLAVGPAGRLWGVSASPVSAGRVPPASSSLLHRWLEQRKERNQMSNQIKGEDFKMIWWSQSC